jgi:type III restriction enzyme
LAVQAARVSPQAYEQGVPFRVPLLCVREQGQLYEFENTVLLDHPWKLSAKDATLPGSYDPQRRPQGQSGVVDIATTGRVETAVVPGDGRETFVGTLHQQTLALGDSATWTIDGLVAWLDRHIGHQDIPLAESAEFLRMAVRGLMARHGITDVDILARDRFRLREVIETRIQQHRDEERRGTFQGLLLSDSALTVHDDFAVDFRTMVYEPSWLYEGGFKFKKHYFGPKPASFLRQRRVVRLLRSSDAPSTSTAWQRSRRGFAISPGSGRHFDCKPPKTTSTQISSVSL